MYRRSFGSILFLLLIVAILALLPLIRGGGGVAPMPPMFDEGLSLAEAEARAAAEGRLTLVYATADWCGPCQRFKRGALVDPEVEAWVAAHTVPTVLDLTSPHGEAAEHAQRLGIGPIPAIILLREGEEVARRQGAAPAGLLLRWLEGVE